MKSYTTITTESKRQSIVRTIARLSAVMLLVSLLLPAFAADAAFNQATNSLGDWVMKAGALLAAWGVVIVGSNVKDHNGPGINNGVWTIVGGALVAAASVIIKSVG